MQRSIKSWTVTTNGPLSPDPYFIRLSKNGDPNEALSYSVGNGGPTLDQRAVIDAGFLELVRLGELPAGDPDVVRSLGIVDATIKTVTPSGPGWHRYNGDGYGDRASDGRPWAPSGQGTGHLWPVLSAERAEHALMSGDLAAAASLLAGMHDVRLGGRTHPRAGLGDCRHPGLAVRHGPDGRLDRLPEREGRRFGVAPDLVGGLVRATDRRPRRQRNVVLPAVTFQRYVAHTQGTTTLTVTSPADNASVTGSPVTVTGTTAAGNTVYVSATNTDANSATTVASAPAAADGSFSIDIPVTGGTSVLNVVAVSPTGGTAHVKRTILFDFVPGTLILEVADPDFDDNGPGNYAYPTSGNFHAGAFDIQAFQVYDAGSDVIFRLRTRNLAETFGSPLGAQLVDIYVHDPAAAAADTSTGCLRTRRATSRSRAPFAWNRLIQAQGFGQRYEDADGAHPRHALHLGQRDLALHHGPCPEGDPRPTGERLGLHGRPPRPGRVQWRPGPRLPADASGLPVRRVRHGQRSIPTARPDPTRSRSSWT